MQLFIEVRLTSDDDMQQDRMVRTMELPDDEITSNLFDNIKSMILYQIRQADDKRTEKRAEAEADEHYAKVGYE